MNMRRRNFLATAILVVLLLALPAAAVVQTRWLNAASESEAARMQRDLTNAIRQIRGELAFELASIATLLPPIVDSSPNATPVAVDEFTRIPELTRAFPSYLAVWRDRSRFPDLIDQIIYLAPGDDAPLYQYDQRTEQFVPILETDDRSAGEWLSRTVESTRVGLLNRGQGPDPLTLMIPLNRIVDRVSVTQEATRLRISETDYLLIHFDRTYLATVVVPELATNYLGAGVDDYIIAVVDFDTEEVIWSNSDLDVDLFADDDPRQVDESMAISSWPMLSFGL